MRILLASHELGQSGAPLALLNMAKSLLDSGYGVDVISPFFGDIGKELMSIGVNVLVNENIFKNDYNIELDLMQYSVIVFNTIVSLAFAKKLSDVEIRKVCWVHEGEFAYELFSSCPGLYGRDGCYDFRDLFKYVDEVYCVSEYSKKVAEKYTDKQIRILPYYIKDDYRGDRGLIIEKESKLRIGMFGTVEKRKGIKLLDSAVRMLPIKIRKNITFFLCGGITNDAIPNESFQYLGKLPHGMLLEGYNKIDLLICPSLDDPLPISVCEALMMECPVAVSKNTGFYSLLHDNQFVFECDNADLKDCLVQIYEERDSLIGIGKTGRLVYLDNFTKDKFNESVIKMIKGSLSED